MSNDKEEGRVAVGIVLFCLWLLIAIINCNAQSQSEVYDYIKQTCKHPDIVMKQVLYETDHFKSTIWKENNNLFGMKVAKKRYTHATGENRGHAVYESWRWCIQDYSYWQSLYYKSGDYYLFLDSIGYATNKEYTQTLKRIKI